MDSGTSSSAPHSGLELTFPQPTSVYLQLLHESGASKAADLHLSSDSICNDELLLCSEDGGNGHDVPLGSHCKLCAPIKRPVLEGYVRPHSKYPSPPTELRLGADNLPKLSVEAKDSNDSGVTDCTPETVSVSTGWSPHELVHMPIITKTHPRGTLQDIEETDV